jgi:hypothetical protein
MDKNNIEVTITKQVEQKEVYTLNKLTMEETDLKIKKTELQSEISKIDAKLTEIAGLKATVSSEADKVALEEKVK